MPSELYYVTFGAVLLTFCIFLWKKSGFRLSDFQESILIYYDLIRTLHKIPFAMPDVFERYKKTGVFKLTTVFKTWVFIYRPEPLQKLLSDHEVINRPFLNNIMSGFLDDSLMFRNGDKWKIRKAALAASFNISNVNKCIPRLEELSMTVVEKLSATVSNYINISEERYDIFFDFTLDFLFGPRNKLYEKDFKCIPEILNNARTFALYRIISKIMFSDILIYLTASGRKFMKNKSLAKLIGEETIMERLQHIKKHGTDCSELEIMRPLIDQLLEELGSNPDITIKNINQDCLSIIATSDSPSTISNFALHEIGKNADIQEKIQKELDSIFENTERRMNVEDLRRMKYLECVIKETLRLYPILPFTLRTINKDLQFGNEKFSKDYIYVISIFHSNRNSEIFPNPEVFDPDRFLLENCKNRHPYAYITFFRGVRQCIGSRIGMIQIKVFLATLLRRFTIQSISKDVPLKMNGISLKKPTSIFIKTHPRRKK